MNRLCLLSHVKRDIAGVASQANTSDTVLGILQAMDDVSAEFVSETGGRSFAAVVGTRYLQRHPRACGRDLRIPHDLASITTLTVDDDGDDTYELTLAVTTDYFVEREDDLDSNTPITKLVLNPNGTQLSVWPTAYRAVKITGLWGYSYELESTLTTLAEALDTAETAIDVADGSKVDPGDTMVVDSEQMDVLSVAGSTVTVTRAINSTTAATHDSGATVYRRRYPRRVEDAVKERVVGMRWDSQGGHSAMMSMSGETDGSLVRASYARWRRAVGAYKDWAVG